MNVEQRHAELLLGCSSTTVEEVFIDFTQVAEVLGMDLTIECLMTPDKPVDSLTAFETEIGQGDKKIRERRGVGAFNRPKLLEMLRSVKFVDEEVVINLRRKSLDGSSISKDTGPTQGTTDSIRSGDESEDGSST